MKKIILLTIASCMMVYMVNAQTNRALQILENGTSFHLSGLEEVLVSNLTIEGWVKFDSDTTLTDFTALVDFRNADDADSKALIFRTVEENITTSYEWGGWDYEGADNIVPADEWTHVAVVISGDDEEARFFINGTETGFDTSYEDLGLELPLGDNIRVGAGVSNEPDRTIIGMMDEIRIWTYARSADEINDNMEKEIDPASEGLLMYYKCNEEDLSDVLTDATGNGYDLYAIGDDYVFVDDTPFEDEPNFVSNSTKSLNLSFYPNPVKNVLNFNRDFQNAVIRIYDITGQMVEKTLLNSSSLNVDNFKTGMYILEVQEDNNSYRGKFIKE